jgi:hypothetical protein
LRPARRLLKFAGTALLCLALALPSLPAVAAALSVETDPSTFAFNGYAAHARLQLAASGEIGRWVLGAGSYGLKFPAAFRSLALRGAQDTTRLDLTHAYGLFIDRYVGADSDRGLFVGVQLARQFYRLTDHTVPGVRQDYAATIAMPRAGHLYRLPASRLYLEPWMGAEYASTTNVQLTAGSRSIEPRKWLPYAALHIGFTF